ncbi:hypothetical protein E3N88_45854 [Mikania micrantha]|uniref:Uncharacterized protein n=1 Tax=Mikania micrantha TaxID=192012 RepID=A0A5N6L894_9ASTR|nr:hypothetical protein E3N88_45854 [Mikania micrantha]
MMHHEKKYDNSRWMNKKPQMNPEAKEYRTTKGMPGNKKDSKDSQTCVMEHDEKKKGVTKTKENHTDSQTKTKQRIGPSMVGACWISASTVHEVNINKKWEKDQARMLDKFYYDRLSPEDKGKALDFIIQKEVPSKEILSTWSKELKNYFHDMSNIHNFIPGVQVTRKGMNLTSQKLIWKMGMKKMMWQEWIS